MSRLRRCQKGCLPKCFRYSTGSSILCFCIKGRTNQNKVGSSTFIMGNDCHIRFSTRHFLERVNCALEEKRQGAGALQNASRGSGTLDSRASVLECGGPPPLWHVDSRNFQKRRRYDIVPGSKRSDMSLHTELDFAGARRLQRCRVYGAARRAASQSASCQCGLALFYRKFHIKF
jgi:hypothetical protein